MTSRSYCWAVAAPDVILSNAMFSSSTLTLGSPKMPRSRPVTWLCTSAATCDSGSERALATRGTCAMAASTEMSGSRPENDVGQQISGEPLQAGVLLAQRFGIALYPIDQQMVGWPQVRPTRRGGVIPIRARRRGTGMKIDVLVEGLAYQFRADRRPITICNDAPLGLVMEQRLARSYNHCRVEPS